MLNFSSFIKEHKFWGKSISEFLNWLNSKSSKYWVFFDSETTGLPQDPHEVQLTQISCIVAEYDPNLNQFTEVDTYNRKLKLSKKTLDTMKSSNRIKSVLSFNRYGEGGIKFHDEEESLGDFMEFLNKWDNPILVIQNAQFDMRYLNTRGLIKFKNEVIDTKQVLQLFYLPLIQTLAETDTKYGELIQKIGTSPRDGGLISSSMGKIGPALGINMSGYHDALVDCRLAMEMFRRVVEVLKANTDVDISKYQGIRIDKLNESSTLLGLSENVDSHLISIIKSTIPKGGSILEISCGNGEDSSELKNLGYRVKATEINKNYVQNAIKRGIDCIEHDTRESFPFGIGEFDLVYARLSLHYFTKEELIKIFSEIRRISKGVLFTVKVKDDNLKTGKLIHSEDFWKEITETFFEIKIFEIKSGKLYGENSTWLEVLATK